jgi:hypothetical protein
MYIQEIKMGVISGICEKYGIKNYIINDDGTVDVDGDVDLSDKKLTIIPLRFGKVSGNFYCHDNKLTSLEGCPKWVGGYFACSFNQLTSLKGGPEFVGGNFSCCYNKLTSLEGAPKVVGGDFYCYCNKLTTLEGFPKAYGDFDCHGNPLPQEIIDNPKAYLKQYNRDRLLDIIINE